MRAIYHKIEVVLFGHRHVAGKWKDVNGIPYILASDNTPGKASAREISVEPGKIEVTEVGIKPGKKSRIGKGKRRSGKG
jgi:hypothetical protein